MILAAFNSGLISTQLTPDAAICLLTFGILLVYLELNRPGYIVPGCLGLFAILFSVAYFTHKSLYPPALLLIFSGIALLSVSLVRPQPLILAVAATMAVTLGLSYLVAQGPDTSRHLTISICCGLILGTGTSLLTRIARRARANKAVD
jgi:membrane-bound serine protease (ClpP class)